MRDKLRIPAAATPANQQYINRQKAIDEMWGFLAGEPDPNGRWNQSIGILGDRGMSNRPGAGLSTFGRIEKPENHAVNQDCNANALLSRIDDLAGRVGVLEKSAGRDGTEPVRDDFMRELARRELAREIVERIRYRDVEGFDTEDQATLDFVESWIEREFAGEERDGGGTNG